MPSATWSAGWVTGDIVTAAEFRKGAGCIADSTLSVAAASFDFTGMPTSYAQLAIWVYGRGDTVATSVPLAVRFNADNAANYDSICVMGSGTSTTASGTLAGTSFDLGSIPASTAPANTFGAAVIWVPNYAGANHKSITAQNAWKIAAGVTGDLAVRSVAGWWRGVSAVSRVTVFPTSGNFAAGSRCSIYVLGA